MLAPAVPRSKHPSSVLAIPSAFLQYSMAPAARDCTRSLPGSPGMTPSIDECCCSETHARNGHALNHGPVRLPLMAAGECLCHSAALLPYEVDYAADGPRRARFEAERPHG